jgi:molybdopterin-guanine dinucleotide biosynthesis protein A
VILAGGGATRFGGLPKGLEWVRGRRILDGLVEEFTAAFGQPPLLVANDPAAQDWHPGLEVVADHTPDLGALGGIQTAVLAGPAPVVVVAWDMPFVTRGLLTRLAQGLEGHDACLPASDSRRGVEPLCAAYGPACGPAIAAALARGDQRAIGFHPGLRVGILPMDEIATLGDPARLFFNINTPDDLSRANELA